MTGVLISWAMLRKMIHAVTRQSARRPGPRHRVSLVAYTLLVFIGRLSISPMLVGNLLNHIWQKLYPKKHMFGTTFNSKAVHFSLAIDRMKFRNSTDGEPNGACWAVCSGGSAPWQLTQVANRSFCLGSNRAVQPNGCHRRLSTRGQQSVWLDTTHSKVLMAAGPVLPPSSPQLYSFVSDTWNSQAQTPLAAHPSGSHSTSLFSRKPFPGSWHSPPLSPLLTSKLLAKWALASPEASLVPAQHEISINIWR